MKKIKLAVVGSSDLSREEAKRIVKSALEKISSKYEVVSVATLKQDECGRSARLWAKKNTVKRKTFQLKSCKDDPSYQEVCTARLAWESTHYIVFWTGLKDQAKFALEHAMRMNKKLKLFQL